MNINHLITRRTALKRLLQISGTVAVSAFNGWPFNSLDSVWAKSEKRGFIVEGLGQKEGYSVKELTRKVFEAAGGITRFISRGDVVAIKPNISFPSRPELAATTNPEVLEAVIELCYEAGAKKVRIADNTVNDPTQCFAFTGAGNGGDYRNTQEAGQFLRINLNAPGFSHIHHIQCNAHGDTHFHELQRQIKVSLQAGCVHNIDDHAGFLIYQIIPGNHLFQGIGG